MKTVLPAALLVALCLPAVTVHTQQPAFRSSVETVQVDVSVRDRGRLVADLTARDFEIRDNGATQAIADVTRETLPMDITFVVDLSGSVGGPLLESLTRAINSVGRQVGSGDRAAVVGFNHQIRQLRALEAGWVPFKPERPVGQTSLFDALTVALIPAPEAERRRMTILFTDGNDSTSFVEGSTLVDVAKRANTAVFVVALALGRRENRERPAHEALLQTLTESTGGRLEVIQQDEDLSVSFARAFDDFRSSYVLRYTYAGPLQPGWHTLAVHVRRSGTYDVRARQGYFWNAQN
ncbi:MAG: VWA domain-containing protein [Vicinamibacterales bacterium]